MSTGLPLSDLSPARQADVLAALAVVETADAPVPATAFRALSEPSLTATLRRCLAEAGRVLLPVGTGYLSGYDDRIGARLAADGLGVLPRDDRAVLTLVLLYCAAIPRAKGRLAGTSWTEGEPTTKDALARSQVSRTAIDGAVRRLRDAGLLRYGQRKTILPGPQFHRLTPAVSDGLWENLILVAQPRGVMADIIRRRRAAHRSEARA
ncbi:MAG: hypothetical protein M3Q22_00045 [Actinomycetota bacterium]|nr:hypothetical protein [Actinomycetota bacterium]